MLPKPTVLNNIISFDIQNLYHKFNINWKLNPKVNILFGVNGSGKTTILEIINFVFNYNELGKAEKSYTLKKLKYKNCIVSIKFNEGEEIIYDYKSNNLGKTRFSNINKINNFDVLSKPKGTSTTLLDHKLDHLIYKKVNDVSFTFLDYRLKHLAATNTTATKIESYQNKISAFYKLVNEYFKETGKEIQIKESTNSIHFRLKNSDEFISTYDLSAGEKQLLIILFTLFLQDNEPSVLLLDEPDISLHIKWQHRLIDSMQALNPNCQLIITTHSPSLFGKGWGENIVRTEDLFLNDR